MDLRRARGVEKGRGRLEKRAIRVSGRLPRYSGWPGLPQVFKLESEVTDTRGKMRAEWRSNITRLLNSVANAKSLLHLVRRHWETENAVHH